MPLLNRLCGLETELAILAEPGRFSGPAWRRTAFQRLVGQLSHWTPWATSCQAKEGVFLANGGAITFEGERVAAGAGLIELATPECRGPRQLLLYQRAMERLVRSAAEPLGLTLIKNDRDAVGAVYGGQENYEALIGGPVSLWAWRLGLCLLIPAILVCWACVLITLLFLLTYYLLSGVLVAASRIFSPRWSAQLARWCWGDDLAEGLSGGLVMPRWLETFLVRLSTVYTAPLAAAIWLLARATLFRRTRRLLTPFLISRVILAGVGMVDRNGRFLLADKAPAVNCLLGFSSFLGSRPVFGIGHLFKAACVESFSSWREFTSLFHPLQRLQLAIGDSNMSEPAEFVKVGATMLVLDAIEAGYFDDAPRFVAPIDALRLYVSDASLHAAARDTRGRLWRALEVQQYYLAGCQRFVSEQTGPVSDEVEEVLSAWEDALHSLQMLAEDSSDDATLIGTLDWPTKRYLLEQVGEASRWEVKKKVDIRYHELSERGYYETIREAGLTPRLVDDESVEQATRWPPHGTPAARRGRTIREFTGGNIKVLASWKQVLLRSRNAKRRIRLDQAHGSVAFSRPRVRPRRSD